MQPVLFVSGTPGRSNIVTAVPVGEVSLNIRSPTQEWLTPTVVEAGSALGVPSNLKLKSVIVHACGTLVTILVPVAKLSGIDTTPPEYVTTTLPGVGEGNAVGVGDGATVGVGVGPTVGVGEGVGVALPDCCVTV